MIEEQTTTERPDYASMTLEELAASANENGRLVIEAERAVEAAMAEGVRRAMDVGDALIAARDRVDLGEWQQWVEENCDFSFVYAQVFVRLATYRSHVERWILDGGSDGVCTITQARKILRGLPPTRVPAPNTQYGDDVRSEAKRLHREGANPREIAALLDVGSPETVRIWVDPRAAKSKKEQQLRSDRKRRAAEKALREKEERERRARLAARADDAGKAYSLVRQLTAALSQAVSGVESPAARKHLHEAERLALKAEESIVEAMHELMADD